MTTRVSIAPENLPYLESLAEQWGVNLTKTLNYLLFDLKRQGHSTAASTPFIQIPASEMYSEPIAQQPAPVAGKFTSFVEIEPQQQEETGPDEIISRLLAVGLDTF